MIPKEINADDILAIPISGKMTSPKACAGGGLSEHWTAIEARKKHETAIRKDEREKVLAELWKFCLINGAEEHGDIIGLPKDPFFPLKLIKKIAEMRYSEMENKI